MNTINAYNELCWLTAILHKNNIQYWIDSGTLLGLMRDRKMLEGDEDVDISMFYTEFDKLKLCFDEFRNKGYSLNLRPYRGHILVCKLIPPEEMNELVKIDIKFFKRNGEYIWCPSLQRRKNPYPENTLRYHGFDWMKYVLSQSIRLRFIRNLLPEDRIPLSLLFNVTSWWAPAHMFEKFLIHPDFKVSIPEKWEEYLRFRYGNWKTPVHNWDYTRDDGGYSHKPPVDLVNEFS